MSVIEDKEAIRELFSEYCFHMDDRRFRELADLFTEDGEWITSYSRARGREELATLLAKINPTKESGIVRKHFVVNSLISITGNTATSRASYLVFAGKGHGPEPVVAGTYVDELVKTDGGWRFKSRQLVHDIAAGELGINLR